MYYFAYGSNMVVEHMRRICGRHFLMLGNVYLPDYDIEPDLRGYLNIRPTPGKNVYGILYDLDKDALDALDKFEGYPEVFGRSEVEVKDDEGNSFKSWVYIEAPHQFGGTEVKMEYLRRVLTSAMEHGFPQEYINKIQEYKGI